MCVVGSDCGRREPVIAMASSERISTAGRAEEFEASKIKHRPMQPDDTMELAKSCYDSFAAFNQSVQIPTHMDFPNVEVASEIMKYLSSAPGTFGVVVEEESSGTVTAAGFLTSGSILPILKIIPHLNKAFHVVQTKTVLDLGHLPILQTFRVIK